MYLNILLILISLSIESRSVLDYYEVDVLPKFIVGNINEYVYKEFTPNKYFDGFDVVYLTFIVNKDGSISDVKIIKCLFDDNGIEIKKIIENMPKWNPAIKDLENVNCKMFVSFKIGLTK